MFFSHTRLRAFIPLFAALIALAAGLACRGSSGEAGIWREPAPGLGRRVPGSGGAATAASVSWRWATA